MPEKEPRLRGEMAGLLIHAPRSLVDRLAPGGANSTPSKGGDNQQIVRTQPPKLLVSLSVSSERRDLRSGRLMVARHFPQRPGNAKVIQRIGKGPTARRPALMVGYIAHDPPR
jgi:hypothetical protein